MSRTLKFRAWDTHNKIWLSPNVFSVGCEDGKLRNKSCPGRIGGVEVMQYTGLKDEKGTDVYEGSIFKTLSRGTIYTVLPMKDGGYSISKKSDTTSTYWLTNLTDGVSNVIQNIEVIGNIYENPNLLEG